MKPLHDNIVREIRFESDDVVFAVPGINFAMLSRIEDQFWELIMPNLIDDILDRVYEK
jgi:hypothetical protein